MKVSKRGEYALRALIDMGIAHELGRPLVQIGELAEKENLPIKFLEQILMQLKEGGFIESKRGKLGGYFLLKPAAQISFGQVIRLIDGPLAPIACVSHNFYERCSCPDEEHCGLRMLMNDVRNAISNILDRFTLEDTVQMTLEKIRKNKPFIPFIEGILKLSPEGDGLLFDAGAKRHSAALHPPKLRPAAKSPSVKKNAPSRSKAADAAVAEKLDSASSKHKPKGGRAKAAAAETAEKRSAKK